MKPLQFLLLSLTLLTHHGAVSQRAMGAAINKYYYPNGSEARNDSPCNPDTYDGASFCCNGEEGYVCMDNHYCRGPRDDRLMRGSCTDPGIGRFDVFPSQPRIWAEWLESSQRFLFLEALVATSTPVVSTSAPQAKTESTTPKTATTSGSPFITPDFADTRQSEVPPTALQSQENLTAAAKAGIAVGAVCGALVVVAVAVMGYKLKKYKQTQRQSPENRNSTLNTYVYGTALKELPSAWERPVHAHEMSNDTRAHGAVEMDGQGYR
ncbi:hypothetical protein QBC40DRAFT_311564 [Triangularia verruculosa]|uniref:Uncharacterized protein n=1 Tax=Triangularia verruculosa TaxID=2587418 RepID=A0AAN6X5I5_9PEZI|nr:hypothetical protein QBC40DRAFT_311564 [Triangularia verruculosa]